MFFKWSNAFINNEEVLYVFIDNNLEISKELDKENITDSLNKKIIEFLKKNKIDYIGKKIFLVTNNIVIGKFTFSGKGEKKIVKYIDFNDLFEKEEEIEIIDVINAKEKAINKLIKNTIFSSISQDLEEETIKTLVVLLRTNLLSDIDSNALLIEEEPLEIINTSIVEEKINKAIEETKKDCLYTNNHLEKLEDIFIKDNLKELKKVNIMVKAGYNFKQILKHYYPNSEINSL